MNSPKKEIRKKKAKILLVDDDMFNLFILENYLKNLKNQCNIEKTFNGKMALDLFIKNNSYECDQNGIIDIIIMDCNMPIMNGYDSSNKIKTLVFCLKY